MSDKWFGAQNYSNSLRKKAKSISELKIALFAPPLVEAFQPSLTLPYIDSQLRSFGVKCSCHNLSSLFYVWLIRRLRLQSMELYNSMMKAVEALKSEEKFYDSRSYHSSLQLVEDYIISLNDHDFIPYTLYPISKASTVVKETDYKKFVESLSGTHLENFLLDYVGFTLQLEIYDIIAFSATNAFQLASSLFIAKKLKQAGVYAKIIVGGHAVSLVGTNLFNDSDISNYMDAFVISGGVDAFIQICSDLVEGKLRHLYTKLDISKDYSDSPNLFPIDKAYPLSLQHDINDLYFSPNQMFDIYSSLGCSYGACVFCSSNSETTPYVPRNIKVLIEEIIGLKKNME